MASGNVEEEDEGWQEVKSTKKRIDHPIFKKFCIASGEVNSLSKKQIQARLKAEGLPSRGEHHVIQQRFKNHLHRSIAAAETDCPPNAVQPTNPLNLDYLVVIDFEATCQENCPKDWVYEIIEFPALLLNVHTLKMDDTFHSYCKPVLEPKLTNFCKELTHITQQQVDNSPTFPDVFKTFQQWLEAKELGSKYRFLLVTDSPWDIRSCLYPQCVLTSVTLPSYARGWIDMRKLFSKLYRLPKFNIEKMLEHLGLKFVGQPHSGIDDAKNICRIVSQMIQDGCSLTVNCTCDTPVAPHQPHTTS